MSIFLLLAAPLFAADGVNIGHVYEECTGLAARTVLQSRMSDEQVADYAMRVCRKLEPKLREALEREWRTNRDGQVTGEPSKITEMMTEAGWPLLLKTKHDQLAQSVHMARRRGRK
jgi:hypothetical protein